MDEQIEIPEKFKTFVETIEKMSVLNLSELVKVLEKKFGVSAAMPMMAPQSGTQTPLSGARGEASEAPSTVSINLTSAGGQRIQVIKVLREALGLGLKEAKNFADAAPKTVKEGIAREEAEELKKKLEEAGATVEIK